MTAMFNPVEFIHQLEREGIARGAAEAITAGIGQGRSELATKADLDFKLPRALHRQTLQFGAMLGALAGLLVAAMGVITVLD